MSFSFGLEIFGIKSNLSNMQKVTKFYTYPFTFYGALKMNKYMEHVS
jgi:hypothetical protein